MWELMIGGDGFAVASSIILLAVISQISLLASGVTEACRFPQLVVAARLRQVLDCKYQQWTSLVPPPSLSLVVGIPSKGQNNPTCDVFVNPLPPGS